jgi:hypothetical protein
MRRRGAAPVRGIRGAACFGGGGAPFIGPGEGLRRREKAVERSE